MEYLKSVLEYYDLPCDDHVIRRFETYRKRILEWNEHVNLTAIRGDEEFEKKHFADSLMICGNQNIKDARTIIDVGTGAGFPGIPMAIVYPEKKFTLMDSLGKRVKIVSELSREIGLENVEVIHARAEELARKKEYREQYDLCVSRAVANLAVLSEYCLPFVRLGGWFAPYKTASAEEEIRQSERALFLLGGRLVSTCSFSNANLPGTEAESEHCILWIKKVKSTLAKYPRKAGMPSKDPLK